MKRSFDIIFSLIGLLICSPLFLILLFLVALVLKEKPIFSQIRPGKFEKPFLMYKLRTMLEIYDDNGELLADEYRLTNFGDFLRRSSLDELPELWNVLKGDMSLVGPRPLLVSYLPLYSKYQKRRHKVRPGITGWAQINGRNGISWDEKFKLDIWYIEHQSIKLDLMILLKTIVVIFKCKNISFHNHISMPEFKGDQNE